ncbi:MAG: acyl carrier protein [Thermotogaceae bacterium]|jgi:acyl carrier protein|nr:acyl carrier protein [Thermotogaceae bacterium]
MTKQEIFQITKNIIVDKLNVEEDDIKLSSSFIDDLGADSLDIVDLVMAFEDEFGVKVEDEDVEKLQTVKDVVEYIYKRLNNHDDVEDLEDDEDLLIDDEFEDEEYLEDDEDEDDEEFI